MSRFTEKIRGPLLFLLAVAAGLGWLAAELALGVRIHPLLVLAGAACLALLGLLGLLAFQALRFALMRPSDRRVRMALFETGYGRTAGWYVEHEGRRLALLSDPAFEDMFWDSYRIEALTDDPEERRRVLSDPSWWLQGKLVFRSRAFDAVASTAFPAGCVFTGSGRVLMRALYLYIGPPTLWERMVLWLRRKRGK
jgi:hypothetical protein